MELKINFNPENKADLMIVKALGVSLEVSSSSLLGKKEEPTKSESVDAAEETPVTTAPEAPAEAPAGELAEEPQPEEAPVEKPKRKRRTKAEIEAEQKAAEAEVQPAEEPKAEPEEQPMTVQPELPFDAQEGPEHATMTVEEWKDLFKKKRIELGLCDENGNAEGAKNANARMDFVEFIYGLSTPYGAPKPKDLTDENRAKFYYEKFQYVQYDPAKGFYVGEPMPTQPAF